MGLPHSLIFSTVVSLYCSPTPPTPPRQSLCLPTWTTQINGANTFVIKILIYFCLNSRSLYSFSLLFFFWGGGWGGVGSNTIASFIPTLVQAVKACQKLFLWTLPLWKCCTLLWQMKRHLCRLAGVSVYARLFEFDLNCHHWSQCCVSVFVSVSLATISWSLSMILLGNEKDLDVSMFVSVFLPTHWSPAWCLGEWGRSWCQYVCQRVPTCTPEPSTMCWGMRKILMSGCLSVYPYLHTSAQHDVLGDEKDLDVSMFVSVSLPAHQSPAWCVGGWGRSCCPFWPPDHARLPATHGSWCHPSPVQEILLTLSEHHMFRMSPCWYVHHMTKNTFSATPVDQGGA